MSRKERRAQRRLLKDEDIQGARRRRVFGRVAIWVLGLVIIAGAIFGLVKLGGNAPIASGDLALPVTIEDWSKGSLETTVALVEYSDFQCPACSAYYPLIKKLSEDYKDKLKVVYRHFPLRNIHKNAQIAAQAAEAAGKQGKFWEMHDLLFEKQDEWANLARPEDKFAQYAADIKLDAEQFKNDLNSDVVKEGVQADVDGGVSSLINATPTFFLNGKKIADNPQGYEPFKTLIEQAIADANVATTTPSPSVTP